MPSTSTLACILLKNTNFIHRDRECLIETQWMNTDGRARTMPCIYCSSYTSFSACLVMSHELLNMPCHNMNVTHFQGHHCQAIRNLPQPSTCHTLALNYLKFLSWHNCYLQLWKWPIIFSQMAGMVGLWLLNLLVLARQKAPCECF